MTEPKAMKAADISAKLTRELPKWSFSDGAIRRTFRTFGWKGALMVVNTIGHLAEAAWHHPELKVSYSAVEIALSSHDAKGITDRDFALAAQIEAVVGWRPGLEGPLQGTPTEERYGYIRYDE
ncbi:MAG TPA: 4a-hydroxytetrahydrobiopterin dehydratase [Beijerinckiaceae bacterium]|nr:4a-hydroxytetrahydrobiopterin dehydratase [Beijerinckiaceae bacterium]